jgi:CO/xanthine dehydrogenase Mo-binding subunit
MKEYRLIGKRLPRIDARDKVKGKALYTDDISMPGMLYGLILRSPYAHAKIVKIDTSRALKLPGVKAVVTGEDTLKIKFGVISRSRKFIDEYPLAVDKVRFIGEEVAAVVHLQGEVSEQALLDFARGRMAAFKVPTQVIFTDQPLPRNATNKVMKPILKAAVMAQLGIKA